MATDLSLFRLADLLRTVWESCEAIIPSDWSLVEGDALRKWVDEWWTHNFYDVSVALENAAKLCKQNNNLGPDADRLREARDDLVQRWTNILFHDLARDTTPVEIAAWQQEYGPFPTPALDESPEVQRDRWAALFERILSVGKDARSLHQSLEPILVQVASGEADTYRAAVGFGGALARDFCLLAERFRQIASSAHDRSYECSEACVWGGTLVTHMCNAGLLRFAGQPAAESETPGGYYVWLSCVGELTKCAPGRFPSNPAPYHEWDPRFLGKKYAVICDALAEIAASRQGPADKVEQREAVEQVSSAADDPRPAGMSVSEAAERMERLRQQGEPFTSQHKLAKQFRCSSGTINKAISRTPALQEWSKPQSTPKAQSINAVVTDTKAQNREPNPEDEAANREFIENADGETRAWFLALSHDDQCAYINDPDAYQRVLGRKP